MKIHIACLILICGIASCSNEKSIPTSDSFISKTHESMFLVNYKIKIDGVEQSAVFKRGTSTDQPIRVKGKPIVGGNDATRVIVFTRSADQEEWTKLTTLQIVPSGHGEIVLIDSMNVICDEK